MVDLSGLDHHAEPGTALGRALHRQQERQQPVAVGSAGIGAQGLGQW
jgi:hypothetical protein